MSETPVTQEVLDGVRLLETEFKRNSIVGTGGRRAPWEQRARLVRLVMDEVENNRAEIDRLTARIAELEKALTWQPIDTAPKDGTWIMGWASGDLNPSRISWGRNHRNNLSWCTAFCSFVEGYITHWTPLPRTTLEASERGGGE